jgi:putative transposase
LSWQNILEKNQRFSKFTFGLADLIIVFKVRNRKLIRLPGFDYSANRNYFFTIRVQEHCLPFGTIEKKSIVLSKNGIIALEQWYWLGKQYPYIDQISFVVMPDHVHGIIYIDTDFYKHYPGNVDNIGNTDIAGNGENVRNGHDHSLHKIKPLPELIGAYKTTVSKRIHLSGNMDFKWQKSFYEHIIRNRRSLELIKHYIETNPENWIV